MDVYHKLKKLDQSQLSNIYYKLNNKKITKDITRSILIHLILKPLKSKYKIGRWWGGGKKKAPTAATEPVVLCKDCMFVCMRAELDKTEKQAGPGIQRFDPLPIVKGCKKECSEKECK